MFIRLFLLLMIEFPGKDTNYFWIIIFFQRNLSNYRINGVFLQLEKWKGTG